MAIQATNITCPKCNSSEAIYEEDYKRMTIFIYCNCGYEKRTTYKLEESV